MITQYKKILLPIIIFFLFTCEISAKPDLHSGIFYLANYLCSQEYDSLQVTHKDIDLVDTLFVKAVTYYEGDYSEALLALTMATLPYNRLPLKLPYTGIDFNIPLPVAPDSLFTEAKKNLPRYLLPDSPKSKNGDNDKLPHFFGNAFFAKNISFFNFSKFMSIFVELFEDAFKVDGAIDERDMRVNRLGEEFGKLLDEGKKVMPSDMFALYSQIHIKENQK